MPRQSNRPFIVIRMGAAHHDVTINYPEGPEHFDLRAMKREQRGRFYGQFMAGVRRSYARTGSVV